MKIESNSNINFNAKLIQNTQVKKRLFLNHYRDKTASFIKIDLNSNKDRIAMEKLSDDWWVLLTSNIVEWAEYISQLTFNSKVNLFAVTKQKADFDNIKIKDILSIGIVSEPQEIIKDKGITLEILQANPKYINDKKTNRYPAIKNSGKALIDCLKESFKTKFEVYASSNAIPFYEKNDFVRVAPKSNTMIWENKNN